MTERFEFKGFWFLPNNPENKIEGTLTFDPESDSILELTGYFNDLSLKLEDQEIIHGFTAKGKKITLYDCLSAGGSTSFPGIQISRYYVQFILEGKYFSTPSELKFRKLRANIVKFEEWVNVWGLGIQFDTNTKDLNLNFKIPDSIKFKIKEDLEGQFTFSYKCGLVPTPNYKIEQTTDLVLTCGTDFWVLDFLQILAHFETFLTLGIYEDIYYESIEFINEIETEKEYINLFFIQTRCNKKVLNRGIHDFLFNYKSIQTNFEQIIQKWFKLKDTIPQVLNSLTASFSNRDEFAEDKFLNIVQALEIYHRRISENTSDLKAEFEAKLEPIIIGLNKVHKKWLIEKLAYKWEPNLRFRLKFLFRKFTIYPLNKIIKKRADLINIIDATVCSRNYYTHYDENIKSKAYEGAQLFHLTEKLRILLIIIVLSELGFSNSIIEGLLRKHEWRFFNHLLEKA